MIGRIVERATSPWRVNPQYPLRGKVPLIIGISNSLSRTLDGRVQASRNTEAVALKCANLYYEGWAENILFSGCFGEKEFGVSEKSEMRRIAIENGVPEKNVILESTLPPGHGTLNQPVPVLKEIEKAKALEEARHQGVIVVFHPLQARRGAAIFKHWFSMYGIPIYPVPSEMSVNESGDAATQFQFKYGEAFYFFYEIGLYLDFKLNRGRLAKILAKFRSPLVL